MDGKSELNEKSYLELAVMLVNGEVELEEILMTNPDLIELRNALGSLESANAEELGIKKDKAWRIEMNQDKLQGFVVVEYGDAELENYETAGQNAWKRYENKRLQVWKHVEEMIEWGCSLKELREWCADNKSRLPFDAETLKEKYARYGFEYNPEDGSITNIAEQKLQENPLAKKVFERIDVVGQRIKAIINSEGVPHEGEEDNLVDLNDEELFLMQLLAYIEETDEIKENGNTELNQQRENILSKVVELLGDDLSEGQENECAKLLEELYRINAEIRRGGRSLLEQKKDEKASLLQQQKNLQELGAVEAMK